ncbi:thermonuclease family protein [Kaistella montana]|uniref:Thermonuclease family protein n=1 Tax=Kaistella montana TaxID=1849733 RepID=A0ABW5K614_9FLAO|nr:thermonuclease family protein [Kaistella montana]MCQ4034573.1 thermonuclease family protein [Kaistella montana]
MRHYFHFLLIFLFSLNINAQISGKYYSIKRVSDGDTVVIQDESQNEYKIRFIGIDAPESRNVGKRKQVQVFGFEAKSHLKKMLADKKVRLEFDVQKIDRYGRTLAYVYLENGIFLNQYLVQKGYARMATFPPNIKYVDVFRKSEEKARKNALGLWKYY